MNLSDNDDDNNNNIFHHQMFHWNEPLLRPTLFFTLFVVICDKEIVYDNLYRQPRKESEQPHQSLVAAHKIRCQEPIWIVRLNSTSFLNFDIPFLTSSNCNRLFNPAYYRLSARHYIDNAIAKSFTQCLHLVYSIYKIGRK